MINYDDIIERAAEIQGQLEKKHGDDLLISGATDVAETLENPAMKERVAMEAVSRAYAEYQEDKKRKQPGPARRKAPKVPKRKAVKAARKRNR